MSVINIGNCYIEVYYIILLVYNVYTFHNSVLSIKINTNKNFKRKTLILPTGHVS